MEEANKGEKVTALFDEDGASESKGAGKGSAEERVSVDMVVAGREERNGAKDEQEEGDQGGTKGTGAPCDVCGRNDSMEDNAMVLCDGCHVAVHQRCYGLPAAPRGMWFCEKCKWEKANDFKSAAAAPPPEEGAPASITPTSFPPIACHFCGQTSGAMKGSRDKRLWGHVVCVRHDPEAFFQDPNRLAVLVFHRFKTSPSRTKLCGICHDAGGLTVPCPWPECKTQVHARCAQRHGLVHLDASFGHALPLIYCPDHESRRLDPFSLVSLAKPALAGSAGRALVQAMEEKLSGQGTAYEEVDAFGRDLAGIVEELRSSKRPSTDHALAEELQSRLELLKRSSLTATSMLTRKGKEKCDVEK
jgi:hypothetical protein